MTDIDDTTDAGSGSTTATKVDMALDHNGHAYRLSGDPPNYIGRISVGDQVTFHALKGDVVICFPDQTIFGEGRVFIKDGEERTLTVHPGATEGPFSFYTVVGDLDHKCQDCPEPAFLYAGGGGGQGGGEVGGPDR